MLQPHNSSIPYLLLCIVYSVGIVHLIMHVYNISANPLSCYGFYSQSYTSRRLTDPTLCVVLHLSQNKRLLHNKRRLFTNSVCLCMCWFVCATACACVHAHARTDTCAERHVRVCACILVCTSVRASVPACVRVCVRVCWCVRVHPPGLR